MGQKAEGHTRALIRLRAKRMFFCFPESEGLCTVNSYWGVLNADCGLRIADSREIPDPNSAIT